MLFRMVPKPLRSLATLRFSFRAVLFRMVPKRAVERKKDIRRFRAVLFRMVPKRRIRWYVQLRVLELCCFEWFQNLSHQ